MTDSNKSFPDLFSPRWDTRMLNATLFLHGNDSDWHPYCEGYRLAADSLVASSTHQNINYLVLPVVFLYRHYLELRVKELYILSGRVLEQPTTIEKKHGIRTLWRTVRTRLREISPAPDAESIAFERACDEVVRQFEVVDSNSTAFRYPSDDFQNSPIATIQGINLARLQEFVSHIASYLDGTSYYLSAVLDSQARAKD